MATRSTVWPSKWEKGVESKGSPAQDQQKAFKASVKCLTGEGNNAEDFKTQSWWLIAANTGEGNTIKNRIKMNINTYQDLTELWESGEAPQTIDAAAARTPTRKKRRGDENQLS